MSIDTDANLDRPDETPDKLLNACRSYVAAMDSFKSKIKPGEILTGVEANWHKASLKRVEAMRGLVVARSMQDISEKFIDKILKDLA